MNAPRTAAASITARPPRGLMLDRHCGAGPGELAPLREAFDPGRYPRLPEPVVVVYRVADGGHEQTGVVVEVSVDDYRAGRVRPHEATQPDRQRRIDELTELSGVERMPVTLAHPANRALRSATERVTSTEPELDLTTEDGTRHTVWISKDPGLAREVELGANGLDSLYIADGHHRMAAAERYATRRRHLGPDHAAAFTLAALFPADEMRVFGYHRCVAVPGGSPAEVFEKLMSLPATAAWARCSPATTPDPGVVVVRFADECYRLGLRSFGPNGHARASLDVVTLDEDVLPALGITPISCGNGPSEDCRNPASESIRFNAHPPNIEQIMAVSDAGLVLPPKSTWFAPKPAPGLFLRDLTSLP